MDTPQSDSFVFFGATGDLAFKKIFPALQAMIKHDHLDVPVIGVARSAKNVDELRARVRTSLEEHGGLDAAAMFLMLSYCSSRLSGHNEHRTCWQRTPTLSARRDQGSDWCFESTCGRRSAHRFGADQRQHGWLRSQSPEKSRMVRLAPDDSE